MALTCDPIDLTVLKVLWNKRVLIRESQRSPIEFWSKGVPSWANHCSPFEKALACLEDFIESERLTVFFCSPGSQLWVGDWCTGGVLGTAPGSTNCERVRIGQREKLNCDTVATEASAEHTGNFGVGMSLWSCLVLKRKRSQVLPHRRGIRCRFHPGRGHNFEQGCSYGLGKFPEGA